MQSTRGILRVKDARGAKKDRRMRITSIQVILTLKRTLQTQLPGEMSPIGRQVLAQYPLRLLAYQGVCEPVSGRTQKITIREIDRWHLLLRGCTIKIILLSCNNLKDNTRFSVKTDTTTPIV